MKTNKEYVEKSKMLEWLFKKMTVCEGCAEKADKRGDNRMAMLHREEGDAYKNVAEHIIYRMESTEITEDTSDGYHTFKELYHHRAILFSVLVALFPELSWKSKKHDDGTMYKGMFIVGINTPTGQATYHFDVEPYWDLFRCRELEAAPEWDGHTPENAIRRISTLKGYSTLINYGGKKNEAV